MRAASYLAKPECHYVATNEDHILPSKGKIVIPGIITVQCGGSNLAFYNHMVIGTGALVKAVTHCTSKNPTIVGKPHSPMYDVISSM